LIPDSKALMPIIRFWYFFGIYWIIKSKFLPTFNGCKFDFEVFV
jgi:hypothetical protein